ncbi:SMC family ATPase [Exiguobacterium sp. s191]|uniref:AAA family ATPase n=1 Tax=Exiguobacterium sp. s191 TaxID=2751196 RepID=UPI001BEBCE23|nr:SMC family ATPase [Exiguobacterium sp. s191]
MFIKKIILNDFRIFRGNHEFDFSNKKVIVVEGSNGHGKSTIFDAINWAVSGKISRYMGSSEYQQFNYIINNNAYLSEINEASVEISLESDEEIYIKRVINRNGTTKLFVNNQQFGLKEGQKKIVQLLANESILNDDSLLDSIDLLSFIESTLILSQENLEEFVRGNKPTERYLKLEKILGLTRYGQDFKIYLQDLTKEYGLENSQLNSKKKEIRHKLELLNAEYIPKLDQSTTEGVKSRSTILGEINFFYKSFQNFSFKLLESPEQSQNITIKEYENLSNYIESLENQLKKLNFNKFEIENKNIFVDQLNSNKIIKENRKSIREYDRKKLEREKGIQKANLTQSQLKDIEKINEYLNKNKIEKKNIDSEINNIIEKIEDISYKIGVNNKKISKEKMSLFLEDYESKENKLTSLLVKLNILEKENRLTQLISKSKIFEKEILFNNKEIEKMQNEMNLLNNQILEMTNQKKVKLESQINTIIHEVQTHLIKSDGKDCLICGTKFENNNELKRSIYTQLKTSEQLLSEYEITINKSKVQYDDLVIKFSIKKEESKVLMQSSINLSEEIKNMQEETKILRLNNSIESENIEQINLEIKELQNYIQNNNKIFLGFIEIRKNKDSIDNLDRELKEIIKEEKKILSRHSKFKYFINNQKNLQLRLSNIKKYISVAKDHINECDNQILQLNKNIQGIEVKLNHLLQIKNELLNMIDCDLELNSSSILVFILNHISILEDKIFEARNLLKVIKRYLDDIALREIENMIKNYEQEISILNVQINQFDIIDNQLKKLLDCHAEVQSSLINEYLNDISLEINKYFRQISPHSYFNYINLVTKKNELFILLKNNLSEIVDIENNIEHSVNASLTLSAAQSTILAMSIFLALNKSQNWSKLNVIGIDDPFQNLDDINAYSFIDVLSNLVSIENRQIFISTHDSNFARLTLNKMNLELDNYAYVKIQSYTREAIEIESEQYRLIT